MSFYEKKGFLLGAGFLLGSVGLKALTSQQAKKCYVQGVAQGLRAKAAYENIVEQAKAEVDDIVAEANYITMGEEGAEVAEGVEVAAKPAEETDKKASAKKSTK